MEEAVGKLIERTRALVHDVPALAGAFPDFDRQRARLANTDTRAVYLFGTIKSGKSTLLNSLLGRDLMPRGAGVKTFNLFRVQAGAEERAEVHFRVGSEVAEALRFDLRLLGFDYEVPDDPYAVDSRALVAKLGGRFEADCAANERLLEVAADALSDAMLPRALARVQRTFAGLAELAAEFDDDTCAAIRRKACLVYAGSTFADHERWTASADLAALIRSIELELPFDGALPDALELVDCQGSDSLNPLDFADVESVVQHADLILYVVQNRLGIRQADRDFLRRLSGLADRVLPILNVEAFSPLSSDEFDALERQVTKDIEICLGRSVEPLSLVALKPLLEKTGDAEQAQLIRLMWEKQTDPQLWQRLETGQQALAEQLAALGAIPPRTETEVARYLLDQAAACARALLTRDQQVVGFDSNQQTRDEAATAAASLVASKRTELHAAAKKRCDGVFDSYGSFRKDVDGFLGTNVLTYVDQRPPPEANGLGGAAIADAAVAAFNQDWLYDRAGARQAMVSELEAAFRADVVEAAETVVRLLPESIAAAVRQALLGTGSAEAVLGHLYDEVAARRKAPRTAIPVVLGAAARHGLTTRFYAGRMQLSVRRGVGKRLGGSEADVASGDGLDAFWRNCIKAAFHQAKIDSDLAVGNARENYKYQYFLPIVDAVLDSVQAFIDGALEETYQRIERLEASRRLLLDADGRARVEKYLEQIDAAFAADASRGAAVTGAADDAPEVKPAAIPAASGAG